jgi:hypothetical protein
MPCGDNIEGFLIRFRIQVLDLIDLRKDAQYFPRDGRAQ